MTTALVQLLTGEGQRLPEIAGRRREQVTVRNVGSHVPSAAELKVAGVLERFGRQEDQLPYPQEETKGLSNYFFAASFLRLAQ